MSSSLSVVESADFFDHSSYKVFSQGNQSLDSLEQKCLICHTQSKEHIAEVMHWNQTIQAGVAVSVQELNLLRSSNLTEASSSSRCLDCHKGYSGQKENPEREEIGCLICHDRSLLSIKKSKDKIFLSTEKRRILQNLGRPTIQNCGHCHFHETSEFGNKPSLVGGYLSRAHQFDCLTCHEKLETPLQTQPPLERFVLRGQSLSVEERTLSCISCHGNYSHQSTILNTHSLKISCQTCHIREQGLVFLYSSGFAPRPFPSIRFEENIVQLQQAGTLANKVRPYILQQVKRAFDKESGQMLVGKSEISSSREKSFKQGMHELGLPFSGEFTWQDTRYYIPVNHFVVPASESLSCKDCHSSAHFPPTRELGLYVLGKSDTFLSWLGAILIGLTFFGVFTHASLRFYFFRRAKKASVDKNEHETDSDFRG